MSGGKFDYLQYRIDQAADEVHQAILNNKVKNDFDYCNDFPEDVLDKFRECEETLRKAAAMLQRVDYLICGDDGIESFHKRWKEEVPHEE